MKHTVEMKPARLVVSLLGRQEDIRSEALGKLTPGFGPLVYWSAPIAFGDGMGYLAEMGPGLTRRLAVFEQLVKPRRLAEIKALTTEVEAGLAVDGRRRVNIDPGYLNPDAFVLASHKPAGHRVVIAQGCYAEIELYFHSGAWQPLPWSYSDFRQEDTLQVFAGIRERYLWQLAQTDRSF